MQTLYIMQGVPGSGKTTIAEKLYTAIHADGFDCCICSTDDYFYIGDKYVFTPEKLGHYHALNLKRSIEEMEHGASVILDNTNIKRWQCREYVRFAYHYNIPVVFIRVTGDFKSVHNVPYETVERMKSEMEELTVESVLSSKSPYE